MSHPIRPDGRGFRRFDPNPRAACVLAFVSVSWITAGVARAEPPPLVLSNEDVGMTASEIAAS